MLKIVSYMKIRRDKMRSKIRENCSQLSNFYSTPDTRVTVFSFWVYFHEHLRCTGQPEKGKANSLTPFCNFHPLYRDLDISRTINAESLPQRLAAGIEPGTVGFQAQIALEYLTRVT